MIKKIKLRNLSYSDHLSIFGLSSLSERRSRGDMIQMFKFRSGLNSIDWVRPFTHRLRNQDQPRE